MNQQWKEKLNLQQFIHFTKEKEEDEENENSGISNNFNLLSSGSIRQMAI